MGARAFITLSAFFSLAACVTHRPRALTASDYPGELVRVSSLPVDFITRQRVEVRSRTHTNRFDAVLQRRGDTLTLIALTPFGARAFVIEQHGSTVTFTPFVTRELPFPPRFILLDVHRAFFISLSAPHPTDGVQRSTLHNEALTETYRSGLLTSRTFTRLDNHPAGTITVTYAPPTPPPRPAPRITLENPWFGYTLTVDTLTWQPL